MSSPAVQLSFSLRTSANARTVHLVGSWDSYKSQLPLSVAKDAAKPGSWKGTFRFQGSHALKLGSRYWYYYIVDGYHVSHDPAKEFTTEKTTGRKLNILDVPAGKSSAAAKPASAVQTKSDSRHAREIPRGRGVSPGRIACPKPQKPYASRGLREADYDFNPIDDLEDRLESFKIEDRLYSRSPSDVSDLSEASGATFSSASTSPANSCTCQRFGVTRSGRKVKLDCGGKLCGDSESDCTSSEDERVVPTKAATKTRQPEEKRRGGVYETRRR